MLSDYFFVLSRTLNRKVCVRLTLQNDFAKKIKWQIEKNVHK